MPFFKENGPRPVTTRVSAPETGPARRVTAADTLYGLARVALTAGATLAESARSQPLGPEIDLEAALAEGRMLAPIDHPDPAHLILTGTGLTHLGSAEGRREENTHGEQPEAEGADAHLGPNYRGKRRRRTGRDWRKVAPGHTQKEG